MDTSERIDPGMKLDVSTITQVWSSRRILHVAYFGFAIAALLVIALVLPTRTGRGDAILLYAAVLWVLTTGASYAWSRRTAADAPNVQPVHAFLVVLAATYVVIGFDITSVPPRFTAASPDALPGLLIDAHVYFILVLTYLVLFVVLYGQQRGRALETALAVQVVLVSMMFERIVALPQGVPLLVLSAVGMALARAIPWDDEDSRPVQRSLPWIALPLLIFVAVALLASIVGQFPWAGLQATAKIGAMAFLACLVLDVVRSERQRWLIWLALTAPAITNAALVTIKLVDISRVLGPSFAFGNRYQPVLIVDPNPLGLWLGLGILLVVAGAAHRSAGRWRWLALPALALLLPAFIVSYSAPALLGLAGGLATLIVLHVTAARPRDWLRPANLAAPAAFTAVGLVVIALYVVPPTTREGLRNTLDDPSTGRSRTNMWTWSLRDIREHPVLGIGPGTFGHRTAHVPEFGFREETRMLERRQLLGLFAGGQWHVLVISHPHDLVLDVLEGMGVVGVIALIFVVAVPCLAAWRLLDRDREDGWWFSAMGLGMLVMTFTWSLTALGDNVAMLPIAGWIAFGMVALIFSGDDAPSMTMPLLLASPRRRHVAAAAGALVIMLVFIVRPLASLTGEEIARTRALSGEPQRARDIHLLAARLDPFDPVPQARGGVLQVQFGDINGGLRSFREVDDRSPGRPDVAALLGTTQWSAGDLDGAEQTFRAGIADDPWLARGSDLYTPLALLLIGQGRDDEALSLLAEGFWVSPINVADPAWVVDADAHTVLLDRTYHDGDQPDDDPVLRARILQRIGVFTPDQPNVEAGDLSITRVFDLMEADARATLQSDPERGVEMLDQLALSYSTAQLPEGARRLLEEAVRVQPDANFARYDLARTYLALDDDASAIHELQEVIRIGNASSRYDLRVAFAERDLALIASRQERFADAATLMRQALKDYRWAYLPFANETLARAYDNLGDPDEAEKWRRRERFLNGG